MKPASKGAERMQSANDPKGSAALLHRPIFLSSLAFSFLAFGLPIYGKALGASALEIGGLYSVLVASIVVLRPLVGWAIDRLGRKYFLVVGFAGYAAAMGLFALATTIAGLYLARLMQGIASSLLWIAVSTVVADLAPAGARSKAMGRVGEMGARGEVVGVFIGFFLLTLFSEAWGWTAAFTFYTAMNVVAAWTVWRRMPETRPVVETAVAREKWRPSRPFLMLLVIVFTTGFSAALIAPIYLIFLQDKFTTDMATLALAFLPAGLVYSVLPSRLGGLSDRFGRGPLMAVGLVGAGLLSLLLPGLPTLLWLAALYTLSAAGWAMADPAEAAMVADLTGQETRGRGYGFYRFAGDLGALFGPLLGGWLYDSLGQAVPFYMNGILLLASAAWIFLFLRQAPALVPERESRHGVRFHL